MGIARVLMMDWRNEHWHDLAATEEFFSELRSHFDFDGWYKTSDILTIQRLKGQRDVFEAIQTILGKRRED